MTYKLYQELVELVNAIVQPITESLLSHMLFLSCAFKKSLQTSWNLDLTWYYLVLDILEFKSYLVVVNNYSKWLEIKRLASKSSGSVITVLREVFSTHGIPEIIFGDNNPLDSYECREYASSIGSSIVTSSLEYPRSNGLAENGVHIAKQLLRKCYESGTYYLDGLREYNNTPLTRMAFSPSQILMSRMVRTCVPTRSQNLEPRVVDLGNVPQVLQHKVKYQHDRRARRKPVEFAVVGEVVTGTKGP
ncbi:hypothetical protein FOCC_FOCC015738 [Frankliniella occidentalis]|nr:hypothetical protein FOCC_FOCC015738 [Frankliniella occidentalis]